MLTNYANDTRGQSCLILGYSQNRSIHIVCGYTSIKWIRIITVCIPKWANEKTRG